jgi:hypothetical protein
MHRRIVALACIAVGLAGAGHAADKPKRAPIENTWIIAPKLVQGYTLLKTVNFADQGELMAGVELRYRDMLSPLMTPDVYIYPAGGGQSLDQAEQTFRQSVTMAARLHVYSDVRWGEARPFVLKRQDGSQWNGRMLPMQVRHKDGDYASRTYLFHHGVYDYKVRIDMPADAAPGFATEADTLVRAVLPAVQVVSTGSCGKTMHLYVLKPDQPVPSSYAGGVSPDGFDIAIRESELKAGAADATHSPLVVRTLLAAQRQVASGCTSLAYSPPSNPATATLKLQFPAGFWATKPTGK